MSLDNQSIYDIRVVNLLMFEFTYSNEARPHPTNPRIQGQLYLDDSRRPASCGCRPRSVRAGYQCTQGTEAGTARHSADASSL